VTDTAASLLAEMQSYQRSWDGLDAPPLEREFGQRLVALDPRELLVHLFRTYSDSELRTWLSSLAFLWRGVPYCTWLQILERLADDRRFVYQFLWFASESLALDIHRLPVLDSNIEIELSGDTFREGGPHPISPRLRERLGDTVDYEAIWRRLAEEGAPMRTLPPGEADRHMLEL
jgi:hypothetical protein